MRELAAVAECIDRGPRYPKAIRDVSDAQQRLWRRMGDWQPGLESGGHGGDTPKRPGTSKAC